MKIGVVGGVERTIPLLVRAAESAGCSLECHSGRMSGPASGNLEALVERVDLLVILTDTNSHGAVGKARRLATLRGRRHVLMRRISPGRLVQMIVSRG